MAWRKPVSARIRDKLAAMNEQNEKGLPEPMLEKLRTTADMEAAADPVLAGRLPHVSVVHVKRPVRLCAQLTHAVPVRPQSAAPGGPVGKAWRYSVGGEARIACALSNGEHAVTVEVRTLHLVDDPDQWVPAAWRDAMWQYAKSSPAEARWTSGFLRISLRGRADFLRILASDLLLADDGDIEENARTIAAFVSPEYALSSS